MIIQLFYQGRPYTIDHARLDQGVFKKFRKTLFPKPDEPEPNKDYDRCLTKDEESDHGGCDVDGTLCG